MRTAAGREPVAPSPDETPPARTVEEPSLAERLLDETEAGVFACDERGVVRAANTAAKTLLPGIRTGEVPSGVAAQLVRHGGAGESELDLAGRALAVRVRPLPGGWTGWHVTDVTEQRARLDSLLAERARSRFLAAASRRLGLSLHPGRTARAVVELAADELADVAVVVLPVHGGAAEWFRCTHDGHAGAGRVRASELPAPVARALAGLDTGPQVLLSDELADEPWRPEGSGALGTALVALPGNGKPAGALMLLGHEAGPAAELDAALVEEFSQRAGIALAAAGLYAGQARTSAVLRRSLVQPELPVVAGMSFGAAYRPAEQGMLIGGDFYDVHPGPPGGATTFMLGDVCGKGVDAAVSTGRVRHAVQALRRVETDPVRLLELLNETMLDASAPDADPSFATVVLGTATPTASGGLRLRLAGGGHPLPLLVRSGGGVETVEIGGTLVGAIRGAPFRARTVELAPGESCVLYTDGVVEARGGVDGRQEFGEQRLAELLAGCDVMPAPAIAERITLHATGWLAGGSRDDIAVLVVAAPPRVDPPRRHLHTVQDTPDTGPAEEDAT